MNLSRRINLLMTTVLSASISLTPLAGVSLAHAQNAPAAEAPGDSGWQKEFEAWRTASKAGTAADYQAYLRTYPTGKFASVAKKRIDMPMASATVEPIMRMALESVTTITRRAPAALQAASRRPPGMRESALNPVTPRASKMA